MGKDLIAMNKKSVIGGVVDNRELTSFRKNNDIRMQTHKLWNPKKVDGVLKPEGFIYGRANRPQTPVDGIIANNFGETAAQAL